MIIVYYYYCNSMRIVETIFGVSRKITSTFLKRKRVALFHVKRRFYPLLYYCAAHVNTQLEQGVKLRGDGSSSHSIPLIKRA